MNYQLVFDKAVNHWKAGKLSDRELNCYITGAFNAFAIATHNNDVVKQCLSQYLGLSDSLDAQLKALKARGVVSSREWLRYIPASEIDFIERDEKFGGPHYLMVLENGKRVQLTSFFQPVDIAIREFIGTRFYKDIFVESSKGLGIVIEATRTNSDYYQIVMRIVAIHIAGKDKSIGDISLLNECLRS
ncbi:hypothetical protein BegalDRAFT_0008 [Beggiatoa alba B18LD]|uniref:Uncharacterized protein n=1 Tax=Beggiatoa alba B18LD TaxID=395493 RepID=I3CL82_9GAMM|nr:hypothetical protein [Beggiatoa alba]EIJ44375.1 hypothetical protein BegalDRAFT_0008 [Beggiatoa alba B18LD]